MAKRGADHQMTQLNQNDADNDMSMEGNYQQTGANQSTGRPIARARQRRTAGGARGMMGGGGGGGVATPTGSPFTNFNFGANPGAAAAAGGGAATTVNPNIMSPIRNNTANPFVANMAAMNNTPNAPVFGQPSNTGAAAGGGAPGGGTTTFGATAPGSSVFSFSFGQPTGGANNVPASSIFGANAAPTPASIFGQAPATNTGGFGETTPSKPANTMNTGFAAFGQAAPSTPMGAAQNNNNAGGFTFGMTPSNNNQNNASQNNAMDSSTTSFGRPMSVEKPIPSVTFGSNTMDANKPVFGSPTTNTTTSGSGFAFANPGVNPFALNKRDNNAIASTNNGNNTKASNADTTKFTFPSTGGFNFGQTTTNTTTTTGGGGGGFTFGSSAATNATDKPFNPFAPKTDASTTTPVKAPAKDTTSGGFSFGIPSSANNNSMATNALGQTEAESKSFHNFSFGTKPSELPDTNAAANNKKMRPGRGFSLEPSTTFGASMNEANNTTTTTTTSSTLFGASATLAKDTTTLSKPFTFGVPTSTTTTTTTAAPIATESSKESPPFASIATSTSLTAKGNDSTSKLGEFKPSITFGAASTTTATTQPTFGSFATSFKPATTTTTTTANVANASTVTPTLSLTTQDANKSSDISKPSIGSSGFTTLASGTSSTLNTGTTTESTADASKQDAEKEKLQEKYYIELRGLNTSFIEHIQSTVSNNPFADLSDSWDAYQKYYQMIDASLKLIQ